MNAQFRIQWILLIVVVLLAAGCGKSVTRHDSGEVIDLSGRWNDVDSQHISKNLIQDSLSMPWINEWRRTKGRNPVVIAFGVKNRSMEHINTKTFMKDLERAFIRSGRVAVVADRDQRTALRGERSEQQTGQVANPAAIGRELGADFVLTGELNAIYDEEGGNKVVFYQADLELISVETNQKVWIGSDKQKKFIQKPGLRF